MGTGSQCEVSSDSGNLVLRQSSAVVSLGQCAQDEQDAPSSTSSLCLSFNSRLATTDEAKPLQKCLTLRLFHQRADWPPPRPDGGLGYATGDFSRQVHLSSQIAKSIFDPDCFTAHHIRDSGPQIKFGRLG